MMKLTFLSLLISLLAVFAAATAPKKAILVTYPKDTPNSVIEAAKDEVKKAGGYITHEYSIIKGFAADAPEKVFDTIKTLDSKFEATVEEDQMVTVMESNNN